MALSIAAILITVAVPSYTTFILNNRLTSQVNEFVSSLNLTRSEAIKRGSTITMCKSATGTSCNTSTTGWDQGWVIFNDIDADNTVDTGENILLVNAGLSGGNTLLGESGSNVKNYIIYQPNGITTFPTASGEVELILCDSRNDATKAKAIAVSTTGRIRTMSGSSSSLSCT